MCEHQVRRFVQMVRRGCFPFQEGVQTALHEAHDNLRLRGVNTSFGAYIVNNERLLSV